MKRFVLWLIRKFLHDNEIVDAILDQWSTRDQVKYHTREMGFMYERLDDLGRALFLQDIHKLTIFDQSQNRIKFEHLINILVRHYAYIASPDDVTKKILKEANIASTKFNSLRVLTKALTNIVNDHVPCITKDDLKLIVVILIKRVK